MEDHLTHCIRSGTPCLIAAKIQITRCSLFMEGAESLSVKNGETFRNSLNGLTLLVGVRKGIPWTGLTQMETIALKIADGQTTRRSKTINARINN